MVANIKIKNIFTNNISFKEIILLKLYKVKLIISFLFITK